MSFYELLLPQITILLGILMILVLGIMNEEDLKTSWLIQTVVLMLACLQQGLIYRITPTMYMRGGMVLDGMSQALSLAILILALLVHLNRRREARTLSIQTNILFLGMTLFSLFSVQTNRLLFGILAIVGVIWTCHGALAAEAKLSKQTALVHSGILRGFLYLMGGVFLCVFCFAAFGETQIDEIQRIVVRSKMNESAIYFVEVLVIFLAALAMGIPPFQGILGQVRKTASWSMAIGSTGLLCIVGINIFLRWAIMIFSRAAVGRFELESLSQLDIFLVIRIIAIIGLVLVPFLALLNQTLRSSLLLIILNPFIQALFAISFGQREVLGFATGYIFISTFNLGILIFSIRTLGLTEEFSLENWAGIGRRSLVPTLIFILSLTSLAGISPFFGSMLLQKTLSIKVFSGFALLLNVALSGYYVVRLAELAFQNGRNTEPTAIPLTKFQKIWFVGQFMVLIFVGIFWQPLYKYGAYSIRGLFGDI